MKTKAVIFSNLLDEQMQALLDPYLQISTFGNIPVTYVLVEEFMAGYPLCTLSLGKEMKLTVDVQSHAIAGVVTGENLRPFGFSMG